MVLEFERVKTKKKGKKRRRRSWDYSLSWMENWFVRIVMAIGEDNEFQSPKKKRVNAPLKGT